MVSAIREIRCEERPPVEDVSATCMLQGDQLAVDWLDEHAEMAQRKVAANLAPRNNRADSVAVLSSMNTRADIILELRDFRRDWRRWGAAERIGGVARSLLAVARTDRHVPRDASPLSRGELP